MRHLTIAFSIALLSGCATTYFVHDTKSPDQFAADNYDCSNIAAQRTANYGSGFAGNPFIQVDEQKKCLKLKYGWREQTQQRTGGGGATSGGGYDY